MMKTCMDWLKTLSGLILNSHSLLHRDYAIFAYFKKVLLA